jgi:hypothetical protein
MSGSAFTPGPWEVRSEGQYSTFIGPIDGTGHVAEAHQYSNGRRPTPEERGPNARLIAAAPELYEALAELLKHAGIADAAAEDIDGEDHARESAARRALAKARGECRDEGDVL